MFKTFFNLESTLKNNRIGAVGRACMKTGRRCKLQTQDSVFSSNSCSAADAAAEIRPTNSAEETQTVSLRPYLTCTDQWKHAMDDCLF